MTRPRPFAWSGPQAGTTGIREHDAQTGATPRAQAIFALLLTTFVVSACAEGMQSDADDTAAADPAASDEVVRLADPPAGPVEDEPPVLVGVPRVDPPDDDSRFDDALGRGLDLPEMTGEVHPWDPGVGKRCSDARPCAAGLTCEAGVCALDCGAQARCDGAGESAVCCAVGEACYQGACAPMGQACALGELACGASGACPLGEQCDPALGHCMPTLGDATCVLEPDGTLDPELLWHWQGDASVPGFDQVIATPTVADLNGDGVADIVVPVSDQVNGLPTDGAVLCALSGAGNCTGGAATLWCTSATEARVNWAAQVAVADLDGDGEPIVVAGDARPGSDGLLTNGITAYTADGQRIPGFGTDAAGNPVDVRIFAGGPAIADLEGDGLAEVIVGFTVFDHDGKLRWQQPGGEGNNWYGGLTVAVDLDGIPGLEIVGGNMAYRADGTPFWPAGADARGFPDGWPAIADFDGDGLPEVVVVSMGKVRIFDRHGQRFSQNDGSVPGMGGAPTVADLDGDGVPEIAVAGADALTVFAVGTDADHTLSVHWMTEADDGSSNITGSSVFDFDGDGRTEVIYADECHARVFDGPGDGLGNTSVRFEVPNSSCTGTEYPVVADVTGDGRAEFVVVSNDATGLPGGCAPRVERCGEIYPNYVPTRGVRVFRDRQDQWVATRPIWNQHSYHVTNVCDGRDGVCDSAPTNRSAAIPPSPQPSWSTPGLNAYRVNARPEGALAAPDLVVSRLMADVSACPEAMTLLVTVSNAGAIGVGPGIPVEVSWLRADGVRQALGTVVTEAGLQPGGSETIALPVASLPASAATVPMQLEAVVDADPSSPHGRSAECREGNNATLRTVQCSPIN